MQEVSLLESTSERQIKIFKKGSKVKFSLGNIFAYALLWFKSIFGDIWWERNVNYWRKRRIKEYQF